MLITTQRCFMFIMIVVSDNAGLSTLMDAPAIVGGVIS